MTKQQPFFIGIDPGGSGAIAIISEDLTRYKAVRYPGSYVDATKVLRQLIRSAEGAGGIVALAVIEKAQAMTKGGIKQGAKSMFTYGTNYGVWLGALAMAEVRHIAHAPRTWQAAILGSGTGETKERSVEEAKAVFSRSSFQYKADHGKADALNIARYARQLYLTGKS